MRGKKNKFLRNKEVIFAYCINDVNVLRQACSAFRNLFLKLMKMCLFQDTITISICHKVLRTMFLKPDNVGIILRVVYRIGDRQSIEALQWFSYIGQTRRIITHAGNGRKVHLAGLPNLKFYG
jgi:hypothetical protein